MLTFRDWFALLNYGYRVNGGRFQPICHDVSRYIVGQGRSYVRCDDANPGKLNVEQACKASYKAGYWLAWACSQQMTVENSLELGSGHRSA